MLICGDVIRPRLAWMLTRTHRYLALVMAETRDPAGFARLRELAEGGPPSSLDDARYAATRVATLMACKGGDAAGPVGEFHRQRPPQGPQARGWTRDRSEPEPPAGGVPTPPNPASLTLSAPAPPCWALLTSENRAFTPSAIRKLLISALAATGLTDAADDPLMFSPHDFRRIFVTAHYQFHERPAAG